MSYDYFDSLTIPQKKLIQNIKDVLDVENNAGRNKTQFIFGRKIPVIDEDQYQILINNFDKSINNQVLAPYIYKDKPLNLEEGFGDEEPEEKVAELAIFEFISSNNHTINEKLKYSKRINNIECDIPANGLQFRIKFEKLFTVKTIGIRFEDGNVASYKFDIVFIGQDNKIISEIKSQRNGRISSLMEFYTLQTAVPDVDRMVIKIISKYNIKDIAETVAKIGDIIISDQEVDAGMVASKMVACYQVENEESNSTYANHPSLIDLRVSPNGQNYPTMYEMQTQNVYSDNLAKINEKEIKFYNNVQSDNVLASTERGCLIRIGNRDIDKYPDDSAVFNLSTLEKKGTIRYGGYKNKLIALKFTPIVLDEDWNISLVTRGGDIEDTNPNNFHGILKMDSEKCTFTRQLVQGKGDTFDDEITPAFPLKLEVEQEIGIMIYQFNVDDRKVQYFIYVKRHNDMDWKLYNSFIDGDNLNGKNYGTQSIFWGGVYDYLFFNGIKKMKLSDLTVGELVTPIRKVD